jgi:hypothetical protein
VARDKEAKQGLPETHLQLRHRKEITAVMDLPKSFHPPQAGRVVVVEAPMQ